VAAIQIERLKNEADAAKTSFLELSELVKAVEKELDKRAVISSDSLEQLTTVNHYCSRLYKA